MKWREFNEERMSFFLFFTFGVVHMIIYCNFCFCSSCLLMLIFHFTNIYVEDVLCVHEWRYARILAHGWKKVNFLCIRDALIKPVLKVFLIFMYIYEYSSHMCTHYVPCYVSYLTFIFNKHKLTFLMPTKLKICWFRLKSKRAVYKHNIRDRNIYLCLLSTQHRCCCGRYVVICVCM